MSTGIFNLTKAGTRYLDIGDRCLGSANPTIDTLDEGAVFVDCNVQDVSTIDEHRSVYVCAHNAAVGEEDEMIFIELAPAEAIELGHALISNAGRAVRLKNDHAPYILAQLARINGVAKEAP